jgi:RNA polymerase sigma-70 factor (ECF subfamily)
MDGHQPDSEAEARFVALYHRHSAAVTGYALRRCSADDAADVVAETFVVAWRRLDAIPDEPAVKPWLLGVARRVLANQRRGLRRRGELVRKVSTYMAPRFHEIADIERYGEAAVVVEALNTLPVKDRELLMLVAWEELTPAEIAVTLGVSGAIVRKRLYRARQRLAAAADYIDEERGATRGHLPVESNQDVLPMVEERQHNERV